MSTMPAKNADPNKPKRVKLPKIEVKLVHAETNSSMRIRAREKNGVVSVSAIPIGKNEAGKRASFGKGALPKTFTKLEDARPEVDRLTQAAMKLGWAVRQKGESTRTAKVAFDANNLPSPKQVHEFAVKKLADRAAQKAARAAKAPKVEAPKGKK